MGGNCSVGFTFKKVIQSFFFIFANIQTEAFDMDFALGIILDGNLGTLLLTGWNGGNQIE